MKLHEARAALQPYRRDQEAVMREEAMAYEIFARAFDLYANHAYKPHCLPCPYKRRPNK